MTLVGDFLHWLKFILHNVNVTELKGREWEQAYPQRE